MKKFTFIKQYTLSDLFDSTFKMLKYTWKNTLIICGICFVPLCLITVYFLTYYFKILSHVIEAGISSDISNVMEVLKPFINLFGFLLLFSIVSGVIYFFVKGVVVLTSFRAALSNNAPGNAPGSDLAGDVSDSSVSGENNTTGESLDLKVIVRVVFGDKLGKLILQGILFFLILLGTIVGCSLVLGILTAVSAMINTGLMVFVLVLCYIAMTCFVIWLVISFTFIQEEIIFSDTPVTESFKKSFNLVKGNWWRVFGIFLVLNIALSFFISIVTSPIIFSFIAPFYSELFENILQGGSITDLYSSMLSMYSKAIVPLYFSTLVSLLFTYFIVPVFSSLFYLDLKFRKKEIGVEPVNPESVAGPDVVENTGESIGDNSQDSVITEADDDK